MAENIHRPGQAVRGYMDSPQRGGMVDGAEMRGTYGVMMREWAEMVMRVQTGEVSGVASKGVIGRAGGNSTGPCRWRKHGQSCRKDAKCTEVQPWDQIGLLLEQK